MKKRLHQKWSVFSVTKSSIHAWQRSYLVIQAEFLDRWWDDKLGLFKLAVILSLPYGFFIWGYDNSFTSDSLLTSDKQSSSIRCSDDFLGDRAVPIKLRLHCPRGHLLYRVSGLFIGCLPD